MACAAAATCASVARWCPRRGSGSGSGGGSGAAAAAAAAVRLDLPPRCVELLHCPHGGEPLDGAAADVHEAKGLGHDVDERLRQAEAGWEEERLTGEGKRAGGALLRSRRGRGGRTSVYSAGPR